MDDDDGNIHDYDAKLYVGDLEVASMTDKIPDELLSAFTDEMHRTRTATEAAHPQIEPGDIVNEFAAPGPVIADRLDVLGFRPVRVLHAIDRVLDDTRSLDDLARGYLSEGSEPVYDAERSRLAGFTATDWIAELGVHTHGSVPTGGHRLENTDWLMSLITDVDRRIALWAALMACPGEEVRFDVTHMYAMGALETIDGLCSNGLAAVRAAGSAHAPIVVLAEGRTDIEFLEPALRLLYPHLVDLMRFMDFGQRPRGSADALVGTVKAFAATGVANRVVALFDNDTSAADALRSLDRSRLPANIRVCQYPPLDLAADYPTLGPPPGQSRAANADVNGLAGSIEMYLGRDVLTGPGGELRPVHWRAYVPGMRQYQGEIMDKNTIQDAYRAKLRTADTDPSQIAYQDWSGIRAILDSVILPHRHPRRGRGPVVARADRGQRGLVSFRSFAVSEADDTVITADSR